MALVGPLNIAQNFVHCFVGAPNVGIWGYQLRGVDAQVQRTKKRLVLGAVGLQETHRANV